MLGAERCSLGSRLAESKGNFALAASASSAGSPLPGAPVPARLRGTRPLPRPCWKTLAFSAWAGVSEGGGGDPAPCGAFAGGGQVLSRWKPLGAFPASRPSSPPDESLLMQAATSAGGGGICSQHLSSGRGDGSKG